MTTDLYDRIEQQEGRRLTVYDDATGKAIQKGSVVIGNPTIGVGVLLSSPGGLTDDEVDYLLRNRVNIAVSYVHIVFPAMNSLNSVRFDVLTQMAYQMGLTGLRGFPKMIAAVKFTLISAARDVLASIVASTNP